MNNAFRRLYPAGAITAASVLATYISAHRSACETSEKKSTQVPLSRSANDAQPKLIFFGSGSSTGCPKPMCTMLFQEGHQDDSSSTNEELTFLRNQFQPLCKVSNLAIEGDPKYNKNYRNNPCLVISHYEQGERKNIFIDVGKTFREGALRWMPVHQLTSLDGIVLTHQHMDAVAGLDDVRGFQKIENFGRLLGDKKVPPPRRVPTPIFLSQTTFNDVSSQFPWLFPKQDQVKEKDDVEQQQQQQTMAPDGKPIVKRDVAALDVNIINSFQPFEVAGLAMVPLPVWHGSDLICLGYAFSVSASSGDKKTNVVYLSDISEMIPETMEYIQTQLPQTDILIVDALSVDRADPVHFNMKQAVDLISEIGPKQAYLVGMNCDSFLPHDEMNIELAKLGINVQLAHDGLALDL